jgi:DMSO/TMAO reductase YedYZ molybdopterin-dependent catalytic subunit
VFGIVTSTRSRDALAGVAAAGLGLGVSEFAAGLVSGLPSLFEGLGNWVIDIVPKGVKESAISLFGTHDKLALLIGIAVVTLLLGAGVGVLARSRFVVAIAVFVGFGVIAAIAAARDPQYSLSVAIIPGGLAALVGLGSLQWLYDRGRDKKAADEPEVHAEGAVVDGSRRSFIFGFGAVLAVAALSATVGRVLRDSAKRVVAGRGEVILPAAAQALPAVPADADLGVPGLGPIVTPNADFYRIDTALSVPRVDLESWSMSISGMVDSPYSLTYADLLDLRMIERDITMSCVSNEVGGHLIGNARWLGVPLSEILDRAGVQDGAGQVVGHSVDQFTVGIPVEAVYDGRDALLVVGMNGEPLPLEHGFPARMVVAGLYGYVSATKWLADIELTTWDAFNAYWIPRGWAKEGPIKTESRIDTPSNGSRVDAGTVPVAGVAWAPTRGISRVEVQFDDDADWVDADLSVPLSDNTWVQWVAQWDAAPGTHHLRVRATDGDGNTQTEETRPPAPDGATGWHRITAVVA